MKRYELAAVEQAGHASGSSGSDGAAAGLAAVRPAFGRGKGHGASDDVALYIDGAARPDPREPDTRVWLQALMAKHGVELPEGGEEVLMQYLLGTPEKADEV